MSGMEDKAGFIPPSGLQVRVCRRAACQPLWPSPSPPSGYHFHVEDVSSGGRGKAVWDPPKPGAAQSAAGRAVAPGNSKNRTRRGRVVQQSLEKRTDGGSTSSSKRGPAPRGLPVASSLPVAVPQTVRLWKLRHMQAVVERDRGHACLRCRKRAKGGVLICSFSAKRKVCFPCLEAKEGVTAKDLARGTHKWACRKCREDKELANRCVRRSSRKVVVRAGGGIAANAR